MMLTSYKPLLGTCCGISLFNSYSNPKWWYYYIPGPCFIN